MIADTTIRDEAAAVCRNSAIAIDDMLQLIRKKCMHCFHEPAEIPVELVLSLHELECASDHLHAASDEYSADPDIETIEAMQHIREQAARDAARRR